MYTDIDNIIELLENILDIWARVIEISIGTWLLERQLGAMCIVPLIMILGKAFTQIFKGNERNTNQWFLQCVLSDKGQLRAQLDNTSKIGTKLSKIVYATPLRCLVLSKQSKSQG